VVVERVGSLRESTERKYLLARTLGPASPRRAAARRRRPEEPRTALININGLKDHVGSDLGLLKVPVDVEG
jgi:hypothetical protein